MTDTAIRLSDIVLDHWIVALALLALFLWYGYNEA
jgi:hypothetical protein